MATRYVRSLATGAANGTTWADAYTTLAAVAAVDTAGDNIYVADDHAESTGAAISFALAGTAALPTKIICADDAAEPPTAVSTAGTITTTNNSNISYSGACYYVYGLTHVAGSGATGTASFALSGTAQASVEFDTCSFQIATTGAGSRISFGTANTYVKLTNCTFRFGASGQGLRFEQPGIHEINGGSLLSGGTSPTTLVVQVTNGASATFSGVDLSNGGSSMNLIAAGNSMRTVWRNCKLPATWSGSLVTGTLVVSERHELYNCDSTDTNYRLIITDYAGSINSEEVIVRTGGAGGGSGLTSGATTLDAISWKFVTSANAEYPHITLDSPEIVKWNETTGSAITATVEIITDNVTLTDGECWVEVQYLGTSGFPLGTFISDAKADVLATAANQTTSSETWTTTGLGTPVKQKLAVTFTPQEKGFIHAVVKLAKASTTVYVDPLLTVT